MGQCAEQIAFSCNNRSDPDTVCSLACQPTIPKNMAQHPTCSTGLHTYAKYLPGTTNSQSAFGFCTICLCHGITQIDVRAGSWIDAIRFKYGSSFTAWRGGSGGEAKPSFTLASNEYITQAWVRGGGFVDEIRFITNKGRYWSTSGDTTQAGDMGSLASPCPSGAYRWARTQTCHVPGLKASALSHLQDGAATIHAAAHKVVVSHKHNTTQAWPRARQRPLGRPTCQLCNVTPRGCRL